MPKKKGSKHYAVAVGKQQGIFGTWDECQQQVLGVSGAKYKSFVTREQAEAYLLHQQRKRKEGEMTEQPRAGNKRPRIISPETPTLQFLVSFDGGSRGNPGIAGSGTEVVVKLQERDKETDTQTITTTTLSKLHWRNYLGTGKTNNQAEFQGLLDGLQRVLVEPRSSTHQIASCHVSLLVQGDSQVILTFMDGSYTCKSPKLIPLLRQAKSLVTEIEKTAPSFEVKFEHVYRKDNQMADRLANEAMDGKRSWGTLSEDDGTEREVASLSAVVTSNEDRLVE